MSETRRVRRVRVLLADNLTDHRVLLRLRLEADGRFDVVAEARHGAEAVELAELHQPDVVVLDIAMPVMDGLEALRRIRENTPETKVVILSALLADETAAKAYELGAYAYLQKSLAVQQIATVLAPLSPIEFEDSEDPVP